MAGPPTLWGGLAESSGWRNVDFAAMRPIVALGAMSRWSTGGMEGAVLGRAGIRSPAGGFLSLSFQSEGQNAQSGD